jgi:hypothetical protein
MGGGGVGEVGMLKAAGCGRGCPQEEQDWAESGMEFPQFEQSIVGASLYSGTGGDSDEIRTHRKGRKGREGRDKTRRGDADEPEH